MAHLELMPFSQNNLSDQLSTFYSNNISLKQIYPLISNSQPNSELGMHWVWKMQLLPGLKFFDGRYDVE